MGSIVPNQKWRPSQAYTFAGICLLAGLPIGYMIRASAPSPTGPVPTVAVPAANKPVMPSLEQMKHMADKQAEPVMQKLTKDPNDAKLLIDAGNIYMRTHQFGDAIPYYRKALETDPKNYAVRADLASCLYFTGNPDGALAELQKSLTYSPRHPGTLLNVGIIEWKGKHDATGAIATWQKLLKLNPNFDRKDQVLRLIAQAQQEVSPK